MLVETQEPVWNCDDNSFSRDASQTQNSNEQEKATDVISSAVEERVWLLPLTVSGTEPRLVRDIHCFLLDGTPNLLIDAGLQRILEAVQGLIEG